MPRYEFVEGASSKFWEVEIDGASVTTRWGRIGTAGQEKTKDFASPEKARAEHDALVREKIGKGYALVGGSPHPQPLSRERERGEKPEKPEEHGQQGQQGQQEVSSLVSPLPLAGEGPGVRAPEVWTDALRRKLHPRRGSGVQLRPRKAADSLAILRKAWTSFTRSIWEQSDPERDELTLPVFQRACARLEGDDPPPPDDPEAEAGFYALATARSSTGPDGLQETVVDYWAATKGLAFAVEALFHAMRIHPVTDGFDDVDAVTFVGDFKWIEKLGRLRLERTDAPRGLRLYAFADGVLEPWARLRRMLAGAAEEDWRKARDAAERLREGASLEERIALDFLFPDVGPWAEEDARSVLGAGRGFPAAGCLLTCLSGGDPLEKLATHLLYGSYPTLPKLDREQEHGDVAGLALAMAEGAGPAAVPALSLLFNRIRIPKLIRDCAEALAVVPDERAVALLAERADAREVAPSLADAAQRFPRPGLAALAKEVARGGKAAKACTPVLARLARQHDGLAREVLPELPEEARRVLQASLGRAATDLPGAPPEALPAVLAQPPWTEKKRARTPGPVLHLEPILQADEMVWREGQREEWLASPIEGEEYARNDNSAVDLMGLSAVTPLAKDEAVLRSRIKPFVSYAASFQGGALALMSERIAMVFWEELRPGAWSLRRGEGFHRFVAKYELRLLPRLIEMAESRAAMVLPFLMPFRSSRVARLAAASLSSKLARPAAQRWLRAHPETAALTLVPLAVGPVGTERDAAAGALRFLAAEGREAAVLTAAERYGEEARAAVAAVLAEDPLELFPAKLPKLPPFWQPEGFTRPLLRDRRQALPLAAVEHLGAMLAFSRMDDPYAGLAQVKAACDPTSLAAFAWDLFQAWLDAGAPAKEGWAFQALAHFGDDGCVRRLVPRIREWPVQQAYGRAVNGLEVLAALGSDVALMHLHGIAQKAKHKTLQARAEETIDEIAARRGLSAEDLADRLVPDLGLGADGSLTLDFGPRAFRVGFDQYLKPFVRDADGKRLADLPKPLKGDDAEAAAQAQETWKNLKKNVKALAAHQVLRLELAMCRYRRWESEVFRTFFVEHPLVQHLVRRLVWGAWDGEDHLSGTFRVTEDGSFADAADDAWQLPAGLRIGVVHRLDLEDDLAARWGHVFSDYEILQPFPQIGREVWRIEEAEKEAMELSRHVGVEVPAGKLLGLDQRGWRRGPVLDGGVIAWMARPVPGKACEAQVWLDPGIPVWSIAEAPEQTIHEVVLDKGLRWSDHRFPFGTLDPITFSELVRDLERLR